MMSTLYETSGTHFLEAGNRLVGEFLAVRILASEGFVAK
jgi:hypothetical protein